MAPSTTMTTTTEGMLERTQKRILTCFLLLLCQAELVLAAENLTIYLAVASAVAVFMFAVLLGVIILGVTCNVWYDRYQARNGKGKRPKVSKFWKKQQSVQRSLRSKDQLSHYNSVIIPSPTLRNNDTDTWIKKWANDTRQYEEVTKEIELGDENFDEVPLTSVNVQGDLSGEGPSPNDDTPTNSDKTGEESLPSTESSPVQMSGSSEEARVKAASNRQADIDTIIL